MSGEGQMPAGQTAELSPVKRALMEIRDLWARLAEAESAASRSCPVAIVGMEGA